MPWSLPAAFHRAGSVLACLLVPVLVALPVPALGAPGDPSDGADRLALPRRLTLQDPVSRPVPSPGEFFVDSQGTRHSFDPAYHAWFGELSRDPHYVRAMVEMGILVGLGTINYWVRPGINRADWDMPAFTSRLNFQAVRFDNNLALTNFVSHPFAGAAYYGFARLNELSVPEALLYSMVTSFFWEYVLEWREQVSINDIIFTPTGGQSLGGFFYQLSDYLGSAPGGGSTANKVASYTAGFPRHIHPRDADPNRGDGRMPVDSLGLSSAFWHSFRLGYDAAFTQTNRPGTATIHTFVLDGQIVAMPGFLEPGQFDRIFASDNFTEMHLRLGVSGDGFEDTDLRSDSTVVGYYRQSFERGPQGVFGHAEMAGLGTGLRYVERYYAGSHDMYASTHLVGAVGGFWFGLGPFRGHIEGELRYDFSAVRALALPNYQEAHGDEGLKSVLTVQGYEFGAGAGERVHGELSLATFSAGGYADHSWYRAIGGLDRLDSQMKGEVDGSDEILEYGVWLRHEPPHWPFYVRAFADWISRKSVLAEFHARRQDKRLGFGAGLSF